MPKTAEQMGNRYIYDVTDECYREDEGTDFESVQDFLADQWIDEPEGSEYGHMYDTIRAAKSWKELDEFATGLGYALCEER